MKKLFLIMFVAHFGEFVGAEDIELKICKLYNEAGKAHAQGKLGKAKYLDERLSDLLDLYRISVSSCPKEYQEYGWKAEPRQERDDFYRRDRRW